jgi:glycosyltransferase involved in cell wall biosynthesis
MRIAVWHNLPSGGGKRALYDHVRGLTQRGHKVEAWCPPSADSSYLPLSRLIPEHVVPLSTFAEPRDRAFGAVSAINRHLKAMEDHCRRCATEIADGGFDLLFANACQYFRTNPVAHYSTIPRVLYLQEPNRLHYEAHPTLVWSAPRAFAKSDGYLRYAKRLVRDSIKTYALRIQVRHERANAAAFDKVFVNSLFSRESILRTYGLESEVCYLGVDTDKFRPTGEPRETYAIGLGGVDVIKGVDRAIQALAAIPAEKRPRLVWIGNYSDHNAQRAAENLASALGVRFELKVRVSDGELVSLLSRAALMIYTSRLEPFGYAPLEANACGTAVVAVAEGGVRETVHNGINGLLVPGADPMLLANAISRIIDDPLFAHELGQRAMHYVRENWSLPLAIDRLEASFEKLLASDGGRVQSAVA